MGKEIICGNLTISLHDVHTQSLVTKSLHDVHIQSLVTISPHDVHTQSLLIMSPHDVHTQSPCMVKVKFIDITSTRSHSGLLGWALYDQKGYHKGKTKKK